MILEAIKIYLKVEVITTRKKKLAKFLCDNLQYTSALHISIMCIVLRRKKYDTKNCDFFFWNTSANEKLFKTRIPASFHYDNVENTFNIKLGYFNVPGTIPNIVY